MATSPNVFDQFDDGNVFNQFDQPTAPLPVVQKTAPPQSGYSMEYLKRALGLTARMPIDAVTALPLAAADAGVAVRNGILNGSWLRGSPNDAEYPSQMYQESMSAMGFPTPKTLTEKIGQVAGTAIIGSKLPGPEVSDPAPEGFVPPRLAKVIKNVQDAQEAGYVTPPSLSNPTTANRLMEGIGGKVKLQQEASMENQSITNALAARALGQSESMPMSSEALANLRATAVQNGYEPIRKIGTIEADDALRASLNNMVAKYQGAARIDPRLGNPQVQQIADALDKPSFNSSDMVDAISSLRSSADDAFSAGNRALGKAYKEAAGSLEDLIERNLANQGNPNSSAMLDAYRGARELMAKSYSVGKALNDETGNISAFNLLRQAKGGGKLSGDLKTIADYASFAGRAGAQDIKEVFPSVSPLDAYGSVISAAASHSVAPLMLPLTRVGLRSYLLSAAGQANAIPSTTAGVSPEVLNAFFFGLPQAKNELFAQ